jgi:hypothetical protein
MKTNKELLAAISSIRTLVMMEGRADVPRIRKICRDVLERDPTIWNPSASLETVRTSLGMLRLSRGMVDEVIELLADHLAAQPVGPCCEDCSRPYTDEGFADLVVPNEVFAQISTTGDENGMLCPSCLIARLGRAGISTTLVALSGPVHCRPGDLVAAVRSAIEEFKTISSIFGGDVIAPGQDATVDAIARNVLALEQALSTNT